MQLNEWLAKKKMTASEFSRETGISNVSIHCYLKGEYKPNNSNIKIIYEFTKKQVSANDWHSTKRK